jgi:hypothetical protein
MIAYPSTLPCVSRIEGHSAALSAGLVQTPMEAGNLRQRRRHRTLPHRIELAFMIDQAVYAAWLAWVNANAFDTFVAMRLPGLLASRAGTSTALVPVRFVSDISTELVQAHRLWFWRCRVTAEWMPTTEDLAPITQGNWIAATDDAPDWIIAGTPLTPSVSTITGGTPLNPSAST